ncbi:hypothetical protein CHLRE_02g142066v5 [Chlamydomonas reinhardtii]|uniref:Uncharacterized protein n=1 Tax=Chlamydomonas reinhardtii TaxID=3055 RepID=A0A2K3E4C8_CHLRE|nr:uncharacterized protein CHLRE_02g142066v5 [Chlamydomonas reinhardtii]PNW87642.1 hypothetical protein CHLRE_02g142066v5 [Chlamydomonas reinhardtii]
MVPVEPKQEDKFAKAMDKVLAERSGAQAEVAPNHIIARGENQMMSKHGISKVGQGVVDKFNAARHNTAIKSAMGHPGLNKLVAREEEEKRRRKARLKELKQQQFASINGRQGALKGIRAGEVTGGPLAHAASGGVEGELPNVYAALGQPVPASRAQSMMVPQAHAAMVAAQLQASLADAAGARKGALPAVRSSAPSAVYAASKGCSSDGASPGRRQPQQQQRWRRRGQGREGNAEPEVRASSRVGKVLAEFSGQTDWCAVTVMRHSLATILQANVRGWLVRRRWLASPHALVEATKAALQADQLRDERRAAMRAELERRAMTRKQKEKASNIINMIFSQKSIAGKAAAGAAAGSDGIGSGEEGLAAATAPALAAAPGGVSLGRAKWNRLTKNVDLAKEQLEQQSFGDTLLDSDSDSDLSDMGAEDVALVKMRARTPPWQKVEQSQWEGQWAKLNKRTHRGALDVLWDLEESGRRVQAVKQRRADRSGAVGSGTAAAAAPGGLDSAGNPRPYNPATEPLPAEVVSELLVHRYIDKYTRMGLLDHLPLRGAAEAALAKQEQQQREAAARAAEDRQRRQREAADREAAEREAAEREVAEREAAEVAAAGAGAGGGAVMVVPGVELGAR